MKGSDFIHARKKTDLNKLVSYITLNSGYGIKFYQQVFLLLCD